MTTALWIYMSHLFVGPNRVDYGRHNRPGWGPQINDSLMWFIMESPTLIIPIALVWFAQVDVSAVSLVFLAMWYTHYLHRTLFYSWQRRYSKKQSPIIILCSALLFNILNTSVVSWDILVVDPINESAWLSSATFIIGLTMFISGMIINIWSDNILLRLKQQSNGRYAIPNQGLHRYVSSPNYLGEIIEWLGFAIATWSIGGALFAAFTIANLLPRAISHRQWYQHSFKDYPASRKSLIPYLL